THQRQLELVRPELPGDVDVVGVARAPRGHDRDVVEAVGPTRLLTAANLYFHLCILAVAADEKTPRSAGSGGVRQVPLGPFGARPAKRFQHISGLFALDALAMLDLDERDGRQAL